MRTLYLIVAEALWAFQFMTLLTAWRTLAYELVSKEKRGSWMGCVMLFLSVGGTCAPFISGMLWQKFNPACIFLIPIMIDLFLVLPALMKTKRVHALGKKEFCSFLHTIIDEAGVLGLLTAKL